ncbi:MAG: porin [Roseovarius sp.]|nr:porin [Roseovarius sp.]
MKRTTLRTSAIALGVAAALPATGQEWNLQWGGFMNQHFVFGSTEQKHMSKIGDAVYTLTGDHNGRTNGGEFSIPVKFLNPAPTPDTDGDDGEDSGSGPEYSWSGNFGNYNSITVGSDGVNNVDDGIISLNPTQAAINALTSYLQGQDSTGTAIDTVQIKKVYIRSQIAGDLDGDDSNANVHEALSLEEIADIVKTIEGPDFVLQGVQKDLDEFEIIIVNQNDGVEDYLEDSDNAKAVIEPNAYDQVNDAIAGANKTVDLSGSSQRRNTEVHFKPSVTLENGLTFAAQIEFEGDSAAGVDRSYMTISSDSLGKITLGSHPSMGYGMMVAAPSVGLAINSGSHTNFIPVKATGAAYSSTNEVGGNWEPMRISYQSPSLAGLTLGLSYAASNEGSGNSANHSGYLTKDKTAGDLSDIFDLGVRFSQSLGETNFTLAARYGTAEKEGPEKNPREAAIGAQVGFGGLTLGGAYADSERGDKSSSGWSLGASFKPDEAWTIGIETYQGEYDNGDDHSVAKIAASRNLGPGVAWDLYAITAESTSTSNVKNMVKQGATTYTFNSVNKVDASGTIFGTAIRLNF